MSRYIVKRVRDARLPDPSGDQTTLYVPQGPYSVQYVPQSAENVTSLSPNWNWTMPTDSTGLSRVIYYKMSGTFTITGVALDQLTTQNRVALRAFALQAMTESATLNLGTQSVAIGNLSQILPALMRINQGPSNAAGIQSAAATAPDWFSDYNDAVGTANSPFAPALEMPVSMDTAPARTANITSMTLTGTTVLTIGFTVAEPLILPPLSFVDQGMEKAIFGLRAVTLSMQLNFPHRGLSIALPSGTTVTTVALTPTNQQLLTQYITPDPGDIRPDGLYRYDYTTILAQPSTLTAASIAAGASFSGSSAVVTTSTIPEKIIVWATYSQADRQDPTKSLPDVFLPITSIQCNIGSRSGVLSGATPEDLWKVSFKNGLHTPYFVARGLASASSSVPSASWPKGAGAPLIIDTAADAGLDAGDAPGMSKGTFSFQAVSITVENNMKIALTGVQLYVMFLTGGVLSLQSGTVSIINGGVTAEDARDIPEAGTISSEAFHEMSSQAGFGAGKIGDFFKRAAAPLMDIGTAVGSVLAPEMAVPLMAARTVARQATGQGLRGGALSGGAMLGGARMGRKMLF